MKPDFSFVINAQPYLPDTLQFCFFSFDLSLSPTFSLVMQWIYKLLDCIRYVIVKDALASCDIIFLGWTEQQKDKPALLEVYGSCKVKSLGPYDCKDYFVRSYFSSWKSVPVITLKR